MNFSCSLVSIAPGLTARTLVIALTGSMPSSTKKPCRYRTGTSESSTTMDQSRRACGEGSSATLHRRHTTAAQVRNCSPSSTQSDQSLTCSNREIPPPHRNGRSCVGAGISPNLLWLSSHMPLELVDLPWVRTSARPQWGTLQTAKRIRAPGKRGILGVDKARRSSKGHGTRLHLPETGKGRGFGRG
jgi:hypothetical protein